MDFIVINFLFEIYIQRYIMSTIYKAAIIFLQKLIKINNSSINEIYIQKNERKI